MFVEWFVLTSAYLLNIAKAEELQWHLFHQSDYDVKMHRMEIVKYNNSYLMDVKGECTLYNRTYRAFSGSAHVLQYISTNLKADVQLYKMMSNEYRFFPVTVSLDLCKEISRNSFDVKTMLEKTSNITGCPCKKGFYYVRNFVGNYSRFPPFIPRGEYQMEIKAYQGHDFIAELHVYYLIFAKPLVP